MAVDQMRGMLNPRAGLAKFSIARRAPAPALAPLVSHYWIVRWDLRDQEPHQQLVLTHPSVNVVVMEGGSLVTGVVRGRGAELLEGRAWAFGVMFRPGGFRPLLGRAVSSITDRSLPMTEVFGVAGQAWEDTVLGGAEEAKIVAATDEFLGTVITGPHPEAERVVDLVERIAADSRLTRVDELAAELGMGQRSLQRLLAEYVGVGPKWIIRRYRLHEAAVRVASGVNPDWAALAAELGYADQAHFIRDFTATVGTSPTQYARDCAASSPEA